MGQRVNIPTDIANGTVTLSAGSVVVGASNVTDSTTVRLMNQTVGGTPGALYVSARSPGVSFTIKSTSSTDTSTVYYEVVFW